MDHKYPDTAMGAIKALSVASTFDVTGATAEPDPAVAGVWKVRCNDGTFIVYLAGYPDPWGNARETIDFEEIEE